MLKGIGVSAGVAQGTAYVVAEGLRSTVPNRSVRASELEGERARFDAAVARADAELLALQEEVRENIGPSQADIFAAQRLVLGDPFLREQVLRSAAEQHINVEAALSKVFDEYTRRLETAPDGNLRARTADIDDVRKRLLSALAQQGTLEGPKVPDGAIVVSDELLPSVTARLELDSVRAFVTERGNRFSHSSILARSLGTPAVAGVASAAGKIRTGDRLIVDGVAGVVFVNPEASIEREYDRLAADLRSSKEELRHLVDLSSVTLDGTTLPLLANVNKFSDTEAALLYNADGIGLYRTEFTFSIRSAFPTQAELAAEGKPFNAAIPIGAMIEVPSAGLMARTLAKEVDFLSLGTNDLVQYVLAADREDETTAPYYQPLHPAVLHLIDSVVEGARSAGRELAICGEMAGDPLHTALLLGLGLREFSVAPRQMLEVKDAIRRTHLGEARKLARAALDLGSAAEVEALLHEHRPIRKYDAPVSGSTILLDF